MFDLPSAGLLLIIGIDQFLDMGQAMTNVIGNGIATAVVAKWEGELQAPRSVEQEDMLDPAQVHRAARPSAPGSSMPAAFTVESITERIPYARDRTRRRATGAT